MLPIYGIIGATLILVGTFYLYIFLRYLVKIKANTEVILAVSEALITFAIGVFYIYSVIVLNNYLEKPVNFTNTIDDILLKNDSFEYFFATREPMTVPQVSVYPEEIENSSRKNNEDVVHVTIDTVTQSNEDESFYMDQTTTSTTPIEKTTLPMEINKTEQFIQNYQSFLKDFIKQKFSNGSIFNQTFANIKFGPPKLKSSREIKIEPEEDPCFYHFFIENALLLYSFTHCLLTLVSNSLQCRKCIETEVEIKDESPDSESSIESKNTKNEEVLDTSGSASAPVGPLFESTDTKSLNKVPDLKLFEAKSAHSRPNTRKVAIPFENSEKYKLSLQILLTWILPIITIIILYFSSRTEPKLPNFENHIKTKSNFTMASIDPNMLKLIHNSSNVTTNSSEVDNVVNKIYGIVNKAREDVNKKTTYFTPVMIDTVYFLGHKQRYPKTSNVCSTTNNFIKVFYFFIFALGYFAVILFAKITETLAKFKNQLRAKQQNVCFLSFALLWLPSILDLFYRMFVSQERSTVLSCIFLALGNINRLQTMLSNHLYVKKFIKPNFVNPA